MLSPTGMLEGITALCVTIFSCMFGLFSLYKGKRLGAKLLIIAGFLMFFIGLLWLGPTTDFLTIIITTRNIDNSWGLYGILSYMWVAPVVTLAMYIGAELMIPKKKWIIFGIFLGLSIVFELVLFLNTMESFIFVEPKTPGTELIDSQHNRGYVTFYLIIVFLLTAAVFDGVGFLIKAFNSTGVLRKKFLFLAFGFILFVICAAYDSLATPGPILIFVRLGVICSITFMYVGLRT